MDFYLTFREKRAAVADALRAARQRSRGNSVITGENSPQSSRQFVVIHIRLGLPLAPSSRHLVGIGQLEFAVSSFPRDARGVTRVRQKLEQKLPELNLTGTGARESTARCPEHLVGICGSINKFSIMLQVSYLIIISFNPQSYTIHRHLFISILFYDKPFLLFIFLIQIINNN